MRRLSAALAAWAVLAGSATAATLVDFESGTVGSSFVYDVGNGKFIGKSMRIAGDSSNKYVGWTYASGDDVNNALSFTLRADRLPDPAIPTGTIVYSLIVTQFSYFSTRPIDLYYSSQHGAPVLTVPAGFGTMTIPFGGQYGREFAFIAPQSAAGELRLDNFVFESFASRVPEPATWAMMIVGFLGVGSMMRRSRRRQAMIAA